MKTKWLMASMLVVLSLSFLSCDKNDNDDSSTTSLTVRLGDDPIAADQVNIDLKEINVNLGNDKWVTVPTRQGIYNLLAYQGGVDTAVAYGRVPLGTIKEIRLVTGANNTIMVGGQLFPLTIPSGSESGLKIKIDKNLRQPDELIRLDFDAEMSIKQEADGYKLRPVIRLRD